MANKIESKTTISVRMTAECGKCGNRVVRILKTSPDGLLDLPTVRCGRCVKGNCLTLMSVTFSEGKVVGVDVEPANKKVPVEELQSIIDAILTPAPEVIPDAAPEEETCQE